MAVMLEGRDCVADKISELEGIHREPVLRLVSLEPISYSRYFM